MRCPYAEQFSLDALVPPTGVCAVLVEQDGEGLNGEGVGPVAEPDVGWGQAGIAADLETDIVPGCET